MRMMGTRAPGTCGKYNRQNNSCWNGTGGREGGMEADCQAPGLGSAQMVGPPEFSEILE